MFFSAKSFQTAYNAGRIGKGMAVAPLLGAVSYAPPATISLSMAREILKEAKNKLVNNRDGSMLAHTGLTKWHRPWDVEDHLRTFAAPEGDYGVGVEVEFGFRNARMAGDVVKEIINWKNVAIDKEGGTHGVEATFPPTLYSKFGKNSQACRYLNILKKHDAALVHHTPNAWIGSHVNVSKGGVTQYNNTRCESLNNQLQYLALELQVKYFNRRPYGYAVNRGKYIEYKLFNSQTDWKVLRRYVDIAVALTDLLASNVSITQESVVAALEAGYNRHS